MNNQSSAPTFDEVWKLFKETREQIKNLSASQKDTDRQMKETALQMKETDRHLNKLDELFTGQWGKLMEALVKGDLIKLLNSRGIKVEGIAKEHERQWNGKPYEYDIIAINGNEVVVVEVKTTLKLKHLKNFTEKLEVFKKVCHEYKDKIIYGAVAYLKADQGTQRNTEKKGLFVIRATGSSASIVNTKNFKPKAFA